MAGRGSSRGRQPRRRKPDGKGGNRSAAALSRGVAQNLWLDASGLPARRVAGASADLEAAGFRLETVAGGAPSGPGLVLFERVTDELCAGIGAYSEQGCERILAIHLGPTPIGADDNWRLLGAGASDVLDWDRTALIPEVIRARIERWQEIDELVRSPLVRDHLVGQSRAWVAALRQVVELACFSGTPMLITGATGTGKELVARLVHTLDRRPEKGELVVLDCSTISPELSGSEFFGHERGAFTSAVASREGAFALADKGTLFLDEVGELPLRLQAELLRVIQEGTYKRVGGSSWQRTDFRLICATNRDLQQRLDRGALRPDFYYRIAGARLHLPELAQRRGDIPALVLHFLREALPEEERPELDPALRDYLLCRDYPGNVRDLRQLVLRIGQRHVGPGPITLGAVPEGERPDPGELAAPFSDESFDTALRRALARGLKLKEIKEIAADSAVRIAIADEDGDLKRAALRLGVTDRALQMRRRGWKRAAGGG